jgi:lysophospholipase L1-like esterase
MRIWAATGLMLAASCSVAGAAPLPVHVGGRAALAPDGAYEFGWPGVYFEARFQGPSVSVAVDSASEHFAVLIDGQPKAVLQGAGEVRASFSKLGPGPHVIRLQKLTESQTGKSRFLGFDAPQGSALPPQARPRQIEFIGDSYTVGYGNTSAGRTCTPQEVHDTTNTRLAFGPLVAERLGADYQVNAYSGFGVVRNYAGGSPDQSMRTMYRRTIPGDAARLDEPRAGWRPQVIVIGLGTNDFSTPVKPGERWADKGALQADYRARYVEFARGLMRRDPQARLVLMASADFAADADAVAAELNRTAPGRARVLRFEGLDLLGCDWHPSLKDHRLLADLVEKEIGRFGPIWPAAD